LAAVVALVEAGCHAEAEAAARALVVAHPSHASLALAVAALAAGAQGRHAEALAEYDDALLPVFGRVFGAEHPQTLLLRSNRAQTLIVLARHAEWETECAAVARAAAQVRGSECPRMTAAARNGQIYAVNAQGRHPEAERLAREALAAHHTADRLAVALRLGLARSLNGQARHEEAFAEARHAGKLTRRLSEEARRPETGAAELAVRPPSWAWARCRRPLPGRDRPRRLRGRLRSDHYRTAGARALLDRIGAA
jgi:tetratricopeptide (TPR) repeat protein